MYRSEKGGGSILLLSCCDTILLIVFAFGRIPVQHIQQPNQCGGAARNTDDDTPEHRIVVHLYSPLCKMLHRSCCPVQDYSALTAGTADWAAWAGIAGASA